ncbi:MAG TPA: DNA topoisomerase III [Chthoniobacterales bacterium]|jgi:DNA topoisomerase III|nr:DNA topoisomerase III [Chthoniobacterales bacterium]
MAKSLIIAEKPSVANDIARALGGFHKEGDHFESDRYVISSALGHLVELALPAELDVKRGKWSFANLPIIPEEFHLRPIEKTKARFNMLKKLMKREDVDLLINACDAGREGELIFRYLVMLSGVKKPIRRLWLQSMTQDSIRDAFNHLRSEEEMVPLSKAAVCRSESDWLVGINGTRAMTAFNNRAGGFQLTPVGRVQTPTLAILAEREDKIHHFKARSYYEVFGDFDVKAGSYRGRWFKEDFAKDGDEDARAERIWDQAQADAIKSRCLGKTGVATEEKKPTTQAPPLLYDLTSLQRDANGRGFSAKRTLQIAQQLYERFKVVTYPRTDSRYLPEDYIPTVKATLSKIDNPHARTVLDNQWVKHSKRIFNNAKISDHFAIIPTGTVPHGLDEVQQKIYDMIVRRFISVFFPPAQFEVTTRITRVEKDAFRTDGKIIKDPGWLAVYGREAASEQEGGEALVAITPNEATKVLDIEIVHNETKPPARFTEATLLSAMEGAGKLVEDEELREAMREKGLGTPATRSTIIEGLIHDGYVHRQARELIATAKGLALITLLRGIGADELTSPEMTGEWESKLKRMEKGSMKRNDFMAHIRKFTREVVERAKNFEGDSVSGDFEPLEVKCPKCGGGPFEETYRTFKCKSCELILWKTMAGRAFERRELEKLLTEGKVGPLEGFRSKLGRKFNAEVKLGEEFKPVFDFGENGHDQPVKIDTAKNEALGLCPICHKGQVYVLDRAYACENAVSKEKTCTFRVSKTILHREIPKEQVQKLITVGKTDLLPKFVSKKGRPFSAHLKLENGKVGFQFAERKPKKSAPRKAFAA